MLAHRLLGQGRNIPLVWYEFSYEFSPIRTTCLHFISKHHLVALSKTVVYMPKEPLNGQQCLWFCCSYHRQLRNFLIRTVWLLFVFHYGKLTGTEGCEQKMTEFPWDVRNGSHIHSVSTAKAILSCPTSTSPLAVNENIFPRVYWLKKLGQLATYATVSE